MALAIYTIYQRIWTMKIYIAGSNFYGISPESHRDNSDRDILDLCTELNIEFNRLVSFFYPNDVTRNLALKKEAEKNEDQ